MSKWDDHFTPLLACHDPGEDAQKGGLLRAQFGKGTYIYTAMRSSANCLRAFRERCGCM